MNKKNKVTIAILFISFMIFSTKGSEMFSPISLHDVSLACSVSEESQMCKTVSSEFYSAELKAGFVSILFMLANVSFLALSFFKVGNKHKEQNIVSMYSKFIDLLFTEEETVERRTSRSSRTFNNSDDNNKPLLRVKVVGVKPFN